MSYGATKDDRKSILSWLLFLFVIAIILVPMGFFLDWFSAPTKIFNPEHMAAMSRQVNDEYHALEASRQNVLSIRSKAEKMMTLYGEEYGKWPQGKRDEYLQLVEQETNALMSYNNACKQYEAMWDDKWREFSLTGVDDIPRTCELMN